MSWTLTIQLPQSSPQVAFWQGGCKDYEDVHKVPGRQRLGVCSQSDIGLNIYGHNRSDDGSKSTGSHLQDSVSRSPQVARLELLFRDDEDIIS
jgi:hypothetical protein